MRCDRRALYLAIYLAIGITGAAFGQSSTQMKIAPNGTGYFPGVKALEPIPSPPGWNPMALTPAPLPERRVPDVVVITLGKGGRMDEHHQRYTDYRLAKTKVEVRGPCYSACTLVLGYVPVENLCIAEGAFMAFHAVRSKESGERMNYDTWYAYNSMPPEIRWWIDDNGGHENLPLNGYWTLYDRQMWAMGYPKCKPVGG